MTRVNLLPWRRQQRRRAQRSFGAQLAASSASALALTVAAAFHLGMEVDRQEQRNGRLANEIAELDGRIAQLDATRRRRDESDGRASVLARLWRERSATVGIFDALAHTMAAGAHYTNVTRQGDALTAQGLAAANGDISRLMRNLDDSLRFAAPSLKSVGTVTSQHYDGEAVTFALTFLVEPFGHDAVPQRRQTTGGQHDRPE